MKSSVWVFQLSAEPNEPRVNKPNSPNNVLAVASFNLQFSVESTASSYSC